MSDRDQTGPDSSPDQSSTGPVSHSPNLSSRHQGEAEGTDRRENEEVRDSGEASQPVELPLPFEPIRCPSCESRRYRIAPPTIPGDLPQAHCVETDCGAVYPLPLDQAFQPPVQSEGEQNNGDTTGATTTKPAKDKPQKKGGDQKRSYAGSKVLELLEKAQNSGKSLSIAPPRAIGLLEAGTDALIYEGPDALAQAHHRAAKLALKFGEEFEAQWLLRTDWLRQIELTPRGRTRALYALKWRPTFLAALSLTRSSIISCKAAQVSRAVVFQQKADDPQFCAQWEAAEAHAVDLLHDACFKSALEGDCEPIMWQGIVCGHIRKYDSRLRIEMLRAHMPAKFKQPGGATVNINNDARKITVYTKEAQAEVQTRRVAALQKAKELEGLGRDSEKPMDLTELIEAGQFGAMP